MHRNSLLPRLSVKITSTTSKKIKFVQRITLTYIYHNELSVGLPLHCSFSRYHFLLVALLFSSPSRAERQRRHEAPDIRQPTQTSANPTVAATDATYLSAVEAHSRETSEIRISDDILGWTRLLSRLLLRSTGRGVVKHKRLKMRPLQFTE